MPSSVELCRRNGWTVGTVLTAPRLPKEQHGAPVSIVITALGERHVLAVPFCEGTDRDGPEKHFGEEQIYELGCREWAFAFQLSPPSNS